MSLRLKPMAEVTNGFSKRMNRTQAVFGHLISGISSRRYGQVIESLLKILISLL